MKSSSAMSPFIPLYDHSEWIDWRKDSPLLALTDSVIISYNESVAHIETDDSVKADLPIMQIHRPQYNAILQQFARANKHSGSFTQWNT